MGLWISSFWMDLAENALWNRPGSSTEEPSELGRVSRCFVRKSISNGAQYVTLQKYFSHPSLVIYFLSTPTIKLMLGYQIGGGLLIANHLDQSLIRNTEQQVKSYFVHSFLQVCKLLRPLLATTHSAITLSPKHFPESNFTVQDQILSTARDALTVKPHLSLYKARHPKISTYIRGRQAPKIAFGCTWVVRYICHWNWLSRRSQKQLSKKSTCNLAINSIQLFHLSTNSFLSL
jgi:hypothetical protein